MLCLEDNVVVKSFLMGKLLFTVLLLSFTCEKAFGFKNFAKYSLVPFTDDFVWDGQLEDEFGWRPGSELQSELNHETGPKHEQLDVLVESRDDRLEERETTTTTTTTRKQEVENRVQASTDYVKTAAGLDPPEFQDQCKRIFCRIGRTCKVSVNGIPECLCADDGYCNSHQKQVCGSDGLLYPSHCELHRVACLRKKHVGIDHTGNRCSKGVTYTATSVYSSIGHFSKKSIFTTPSTYPTSDKVQPITVCTERSYNRFKNNLIHYHCARLGETDCFFNHSKKKVVVSSMFNYYDANGNSLLDREELMAIEHLDHLDRLSQTCHLADLLNFDDLEYETNGMISQTEFFIAFKVLAPVLEDNLKVFTTFVSTGNSVELKCGIRGADKVVWKRRGHPLNNFISDDVKILDDGSLYIGQLELYHMGNYTCQGLSSQHVIQTHVLFVQMVPVVHVQPLTQFHLPGATATINCHADGVPKAEISWEKNESPFTKEAMDSQRRHFFLHNNTTLEIKSLSYKIDTGAYKCIAKNAAGSSHDIGTVVVEKADVPVHFASEMKQTELFAIFHDHGYTIYELNHCHIQHQVAGSFQPLTIRPELSPTSDASHNSPPKQSSTHELLCAVNKTCSWGDAVNVRNSFIYATQPDLHRIVVIEVTNRMNPVEIIMTDVTLLPVKLQYLENLDQVWVMFWTTEAGDDRDAKVFQVITSACRNISHHLTPLSNSSEIQHVFLPANDNLKNNFHYGYVRSGRQMSLRRIDLMSMADVHTLDLSEYQCVPEAVAFLSIGGYVLVNCATASGGSSFHLVIDYLTDGVLKKSEIGGSFYLSPDARHLVVVGNQTLSVYTITADGQIEHIFDRSVHHDIGHLSFLPPETGEGYDIFAVTKNNDNIFHMNLGARKITRLDGLGDITVDPKDLSWGRQNTIIAGSGNFAEHLLVSSKNSIIAIDGQRRHLHCEWQNVSHGHVIVSFVSSRF